MSPSGRVLTAVAATLLLIALSPLLVVSSLAIAIDSSGGVLFRQVRVGKGGVPFVLYKFRTMRRDADPRGPSPVRGDDPRVTRIGRVLRRLGLDELPQLLNVVVGDMALVGPRPQLAEELRDYVGDQRDLLTMRASVRPGMTSPWCVSPEGHKNRPSVEMLHSDCAYVGSRSVARDAAILLATVRYVLRRTWQPRPRVESPRLDRGGSQ